MPVHFETMRATSSSSTSSLSMRLPADPSSCVVNFFSSSSVCTSRPYRISATRLQIAFALFRLLFNLELLDFLFEWSELCRSSLLPLPVGFQRVGFFPQLGQLLLDYRQSLFSSWRSLSFFSACFSISSWVARRSSWSISVGMESIWIRSDAAASSIKSMALSGRKRSEM